MQSIPNESTTWPPDDERGTESLDLWGQLAMQAVEHSIGAGDMHPWPPCNLLPEERRWPQNIRPSLSLGAEAYLLRA